MTTRADDHPQRAGVPFSVGVTGHRKLPVAGAAQLRATLRRVLACIRDTVRAPAGDARHVAGDTSRVCMLSALAEGADQIVADLALDEGYELHCPLPFSPEVYRRDFAGAPEAARWFQHLLVEAAGVVDLGGDHDTRAGRRAAYVAVGAVLVERCDLLIAVWDGAPARGPGGTAEVVAEARTRGRAVVAVDPAQPGAPRLLVGNAGEEALDPGLARLGAVVRSILDDRA